MTLGRSNLLHPIQVEIKNIVKSINKKSFKSNVSELNEVRVSYMWEYGGVHCGQRREVILVSI
jgi:hypothetical protein